MGTLHEEQQTFLIYLAQFFLEWETFLIKVVEQIKIHASLSIILFFQTCRLWEYLEKNCRAGQATNDNMAQAHCMLYT
jgi:hypothetical protein